MNLTEQFKPVHSRHANITDNRIRLAGIQRLQDAVCLFIALHFHVRLFKGFFQNPTNGAIVIDDPYRVLAHYLPALKLVVTL